MQNQPSEKVSLQYENKEQLIYIATAWQEDEGYYITHVCGMEDNELSIMYISLSDSEARETHDEEVNSYERLRIQKELTMHKLMN